MTLTNNPDRTASTEEPAAAASGAAGSGETGSGAAGSGEAARAEENGRDALIVELVDEMTAWTPRDRISAFRSWLKGSLSLIHLHVLTVLEADGPIPMSHLADTLDVSDASATGIVGRMEERGLVERTHDEADRRVVKVRATEAGLAIFRDMTDHRRQQLRALFGRLTDDELTALLTGLRAMRNARVALHVEKAKEGLVAVTLAVPGSVDAAIVAENAAAPAVVVAPVEDPAATSGGKS